MEDKTQISFDSEVFGEEIEHADNSEFLRIMTQIKTRDRKYSQILSVLKFDWPQSKEIIEKLSSYLPEDLRIENEPIIYPIIEAALNRYSQMVFYPDDSKYDDVQRIGIFIETLITEACSTLKINVSNIENILERTDSHQLADSDKSEVLKNEDVNDESLYSLMYELIASEPVKTIFARMKNESTYVGNRVALRN